MTRDRSDDGVGGGLMDRNEAARLLRRARSTDARIRAEAIEWLSLVCPEHRNVRRLRVESLLADGDEQSARAVITRGLLDDPEDDALVRMQAQTMLAMGNARDADRAIRATLDRHPHHRRTLLLAARIATANDDPTRAVTLLRTAWTNHPNDEEVRAALVQALLDADAAQEAQVVFGTMESPSPLLCARVLRGCGRMIEAAEQLAAACDDTARDSDGDDTRNDDLWCEWIDVLETIGDHGALRDVLESIGTERPSAYVRAGVAWLSLGGFRTAVDRMSQLRSSGRHGSTALAVIVVAASMIGRTNLAEIALQRLQQTPQGPDPVVMADLWRRALSARLFSEQAIPAKAGADRNASILQPMVAAALDIFGDALAEPPLDRAAGASDRENHAPERADLERHRARCLEAMGRSAEAARALERAESIMADDSMTFVPDHSVKRRAA